MVYIDTSVAVALLTVEPATKSVQQWFEALSDVPVGSDWLITEFASALSIKTRMGQLTPAQARVVRAEFELLCSSGLRIAPVSRSAFANAAALAAAPRHGLRAGDALHLAVAKEMRAKFVATLDQAMLGNLKRLGFATAAISR